MILFKPNSSIRRHIRLPVADLGVNVSMDALGLRFWVPGSRTRVFVSWDNAVRHASTPPNIPSFLMGNPVELLRYFSNRTKKK